jgi:hypothetical protein
MLGLVLGIGLLGSNSAQAFDKATQGQCFADARAEAKTCVDLCKDDFRASKDSCRNIDHTCGDAARDEREACVGGVLLALAQCVESECAPYRAQIVSCRTEHPVGDPLRDPCIDNAQLLNFQCRDNCRESVQLHPSLKSCRDAFRAEIKACPAPAPGE